MPHLHNQHKSAETKNSQINPVFMLNYLIAIQLLIKFEFIWNYISRYGLLHIYLFLVMGAILNGGWSCLTPNEFPSQD